MTRRLPFCIVALILLGEPPVRAQEWRSMMVQVGDDGRLAYPADAEGNRIPDFSHAGYRGGGVALPEVAVAKTIAPITGDNTAHIQSALDEVGSLPADAEGRRGAVLLQAGVYEVPGTLRIRHGGVVLRGSGSGSDPAVDTIIRRTGTSTAAVIIAGGGSNDNFRSEIPGTRTTITTERVGVGSRSFDVASPGLFSVGDTIIIEHPSTAAWLDAIRRGDTEGESPWQPGEIDIRYHRYVTAVSGNTLTIDAPVFNHLERALSTTSVFKYDRAGVLTEIGLENLFVDIVTNGETSQDHATDAIQFARCENVWARSVTVNHFVRAGILFGGSCTRATALECRAIEPHSVVTGGNRYNFLVERAQLILFEKCYASNARHAFVSNGTSLDSGIVFLDCVNERSLATIEGHRRWPQGLLYDGLETIAPQTSIILGLYNRGDYGTGHGWAAVHSVAWRCDVAGRRLVVQKPPTAQNYAIGCSGNVTGSGPFNQPAGFIEGSGVAGLLPASLYRAQLAERLAHSGPPRVTRAPVAQDAVAGAIVSFRAEAQGAEPFTFQWFRNGQPLTGATAPVLVIEAATSSDAGLYSVVISNAVGSVQSEAAALAIEPPGNARLANLSSRASVQSPGSPVIAGFVTSGGSTEILCRSIGPTLGEDPFNLPGALADPALSLFDQDAQPVLGNDDWPAALAPAMAAVGAFALPPGSRDAALQTNLGPGSHTAVTTAAAGSTAGVVLSEIYHVADGTASGGLVNLSTRAWVGVDARVLIAGFVIEGTGRLQLLIRGVGPTLASEPFSLATSLGDPVLTLFSAGATTPIEMINDWEAGEPEALEIAALRSGAFALEPGGRDAALLVTLPSGAYTAVVGSGDGHEGTALAEIYAITR